MSTSRIVRRPGGCASRLFLLALTGVATHCTAAAEAGGGVTPAYANRFSDGPLSVSEDGRFVLFTSASDNLVPDDTNERVDLYLLDNADGAFSRINIDTSAQWRGYDGDAAISDDGRYVLFNNRFDLASGKPTDYTQIFRFDRETGDLRQLTVDAQGRPGNHNSQANDLSADGRYAVFTSDASNLGSASTDNTAQTYRYDALTGALQLVSVDVNGLPSAGFSEHAEITPDGRHVLFYSTNLELATGSFGGTFVRDMVDNVTTLASVANDGSALPGDMGARNWPSCSNRRISADGRFVVFDSYRDAAPGDTDHDPDIYLRDRHSGITQWVSGPVNGVEPRKPTRCASISANGGTVAYASTTGSYDASIFVHDIAGGTLTEAASTRLSAMETLGTPSLSGDGSTLFHTQHDIPGMLNRQLMRWRRDSGAVVLTQVAPTTDTIFANGYEQVVQTYSQPRPVAGL